MDLGVQRAAFEHAIAILIGKAPAELTIPAVTLNTPPPPVPVGVPSELLERRPDIAGAERQVAAANEQIGIAMAAFYPNLSLTGARGLESSSLAKWFTWPSRFWSVGPQLAETLFDAGRRRGVVAEQRAAYDATVAAYRQTVLTAMQQVEDNLAALRILAGEADKVQQTVQAATRALDVSDGAVQGRNGKLSDGHHLAGNAAQRRSDSGKPVDPPPDGERAADRSVGRRMECVPVAHQAECYGLRDHRPGKAVMTGRRIR